jgi:hypothetical protein
MYMMAKRTVMVDFTDILKKIHRSKKTLPQKTLPQKIHAKKIHRSKNSSLKKLTRPHRRVRGLIA